MSRPRTLVFASIWLGTLVAGCAAPAPPALQPPVITYEQKIAWILALEDQRLLRATDGSSDLATLLSDPEGRIRRRAALAIGRVGLRDGVPALIDRLKDPEPDVRQMAAFALGLLGDGRASEALGALLADATPLVRGRAAEALGAVGATGAARAIGEIVAAEVRAGRVSALEPDEFIYLASPAAEPFRLGVNALVRLRAYEPLAAAVLDAAGQPAVRWWPVAWALQRLQDRRALPALLTFARSQGSITRAFAVRGLGALKDPSAVDVLLPIAQDWARDRRVALMAVRALAEIGDGRAAPGLITLLKVRDLDPVLRAEVVAAIGAVRAAGATDLLLDLLLHPAPPVRIAALQSLRTLDPQGFLAVLSGMDPDRHWSVRAATASILASLDAAAATPRLLQALADDDPRVIPAVLAALTRVRAAGAERILISHLTHADPMVRAAAAAGLGEFKPEGGALALAEAYRSAARDQTYVARAAALDALAKYGPPAAVPVLRAALGDTDWAVRVKAAALLTPLDPAADAARSIRPVPAGRDAAWYGAAEFTAPSVSPHVFIDTNQGTIEIELAVLDAPLTAANFMALARRGFYRGVPFHRVVPNFVAQGGDPRGDGEGGAGVTIRDELNDRPALTGAVGMALDWADTGSSQFFITASPQPHLDGRYTIFGFVAAGMDVVDRLQLWDTITRVRVWDGKSMTGS
ncbi:MAG: HEAT repeat domain-containing protein [Acidobacteria bacterium]|nr:HEAT repeat domain-containing protein [Acidobacteriota bacterium]